jgi:hypothetical protein
MFKVEISDETTESLFRDILIQDYRGLLESIDELLQKKGLAAYEEEDLKNNMRYVEAMRVLMEYYLPAYKAQELMSETTSNFRSALGI